jgi:hypothetical protein
MTALNTLKLEKVDLGLPKNTKAAVLEDVLIDVSRPDFVANTFTQVKGCLAVGNGESVITAVGISHPGVVVLAEENIVSDATPLPVVWNNANPYDREGPFALVKDADGNWYITLAVTSVACTGVKTIYYRVDYTMEV